MLVAATAIAQQIWDYLGDWGYWSWVVIILSLAFLIGTFFLPRYKVEIPEATPSEQPENVVIHASDEAVVSHKQSGGQTAHTILNFGTQPRTFAGVDLADLRHSLVAFAVKVDMASLFGDSEAASFAEELKALLTSASWRVDGVNHSDPMQPPPPGVGLGYTGVDRNAHPWVSVLGNRLLAMGFRAYTFGSTPSDEIFVGRL